MSEKLLKTAEAAKQLGVSKQTLLKWCAEVRISCIRYPSGEFRFRQSVVDIFLERHTVRAQPGRADLGGLESGRSGGKCPVQKLKIQ